MPTIKLSKKTTYKKKTTKQKQKQKQKQIQNVTVNVNTTKSTRSSNNTPKQLPPPPPPASTMPPHHTFIVEAGRPQYANALQEPNNNTQPLQAPNNNTQPLQAPININVTNPSHHNIYTESGRQYHTRNTHNTHNTHNTNNVQLDAELNYNPQYAQTNTHHNTQYTDNTQNVHHFEADLNYNPQYTHNRHQNTSNTHNTHHTQNNTYNTNNTFNDYPLQAPDNNNEPLHERSNSIDHLQEPEIGVRRGRPPGAKNKQKIYAEAVPEAEVVQASPVFLQELKASVEKRRKKNESNDNNPISNINNLSELLTYQNVSKPSELLKQQEQLLKAVEDKKHKKMENNSDESPHQGLNVSSSSLMIQPNSPEPNLEHLVSSINTPEAMAGGGYVTEYDDLTVNELKEICKERNLAIYGKKSELIARLRSNDSGESNTRPYNKKKG